MNILDNDLSIKGATPSNNEKKFFSEKISMLQDNINCRLIYRGEEKTKMFSLYNCSDFTSFSHSLFLIGNKGRNFIDKAAKTIHSKKKWRLDDVNDYIFEDLFKLLNMIVVNNSNNIVYQFSLNNKDLSGYFEDYRNVKSFIANITSLDELNKIKIRDYYLTLIHQFEDEYFYPISSLLSVTTDYSIADDRFSGVGREKIILFGWLPKKRTNEKYEITYDYLNLAEELLVKNNLPVYNASFYPDEKEISLKGGILPHYIIGYLYSDWESHIRFDINPNFMNLKNSSKLWIEKGLPIDQSGFWEELKKTNLEGAFWVDYKGEYRNEDIEDPE